MLLDYTITLDETGIKDSYLNCFDIVDYLFEKAIGSHIMSPKIEILTRSSIAALLRVPKMKRLYQQESDKNVQTIDSEYGDNT